MVVVLALTKNFDSSIEFITFDFSESTGISLFRKLSDSSDTRSTKTLNNLSVL